MNAVQIGRKHQPHLLKNSFHSFQDLSVAIIRTVVLSNPINAVLCLSCSFLFIKTHEISLLSPVQVEYSTFLMHLGLLTF